MSADRQQTHVDFSVWMVERLDAESERLGVTRQALIKLWIAERLEWGGEPAAGERGRVAAGPGWSTRA